MAETLRATTTRASGPVLRIADEPNPDPHIAVIPITADQPTRLPELSSSERARLIADPTIGGVYRSPDGSRFRVR